MNDPEAIVVTTAADKLTDETLVPEILGDVPVAIPELFDTLPVVGFTIPLIENVSAGESVVPEVVLGKIPVEFDTVPDAVPGSIVVVFTAPLLEIVPGGGAVPVKMPDEFDELPAEAVAGRAVVVLSIPPIELVPEDDAVLVKMADPERLEENAVPDRPFVVLTKPLLEDVSDGALVVAGMFEIPSVELDTEILSVEAVPGRVVVEFTRPLIEEVPVTVDPVVILELDTEALPVDSVPGRVLVALMTPAIEDAPDGA